MAHATIVVDVAIIGGGPAGCAVAISLAQLGHRVALLERTNYVTPRVGETLPPTVQPLLRDLGVWERFLTDDHVPAPGLVIQWGGAQHHETDHIFNPYGCGWNLDRRKFDHSLYEAAREQYGVFTFSEVSPYVAERRAGCWLLSFSGESDGEARDVILSARFAVAATGRAALPSFLPPVQRTVVDNLIGVIGLVSPAREDERDPRIWIESARDGWWYSAPLPSGSLVAVYLTDADLVRKRGARVAWRDALDQAPQLKSRINVAGLTRSVNDLRIVAANSYRRYGVTGAHYVLVGDAACAWDPLSGQGVLRALSEGQLAARAIDNCIRGVRDASRNYEEHVQKNFAIYLEERRDIYRRETRWSSSLFWSRRHEVSPA
jgi:2-polyprenyl-6-methoxyphenol hydroxylase-like FAD-dependent oxidoreductase